MEEVERDVGVDSNFSLGSQALLSRWGLGWHLKVEKEPDKQRLAGKKVQMEES